MIVVDAESFNQEDDLFADVFAQPTTADVLDIDVASISSDGALPYDLPEDDLESNVNKSTTIEPVSGLVSKDLKSSTDAREILSKAASNEPDVGKL